MLQILVAHHLGAASYGRFGIIQATLLVMSSLAPAGWLEAAPKFVAEYQAAQQPRLLWGVSRASQWETLGVTALLTVAFGLAGSLWPDQALVLSGIALLLPLYTVNRVQQQLLLTLGHITRGLAWLYLSVPLTVLAGLALVPRAGLAELLAFYWIGSLIAFVGQGWSLIGVLPREREAEREAARWRRTTRGLMAGVFSQRLVMQCDLLLVAPFAPGELLGAYAFSRRLLDVISFGNTALASAVAPMIGQAMLARQAAEVRRLLMIGCTWSGLWAVPFLLFGVLLPSQTLGLAGKSFLGGELVLQIVLIGGALNAATGPVGQALLIGGEEQFWRYTTNVSTGLGLIGYALSAPLLGIVGVATVRSAYLGLVNLWRFRHLWRWKPTE